MHIYIFCFIFISVYIYIYLSIDRLLIFWSYFKSSLICIYWLTNMYFVCIQISTYIYYTYVCHPHPFLAHLHILIPPRFDSTFPVSPGTSVWTWCWTVSEDLSLLKEYAGQTWHWGILFSFYLFEFLTHKYHGTYIIYILYCILLYFI